MEVGAWNIRGCEKHKLMTFLAKEGMDVLGICETWMDDKQRIPSSEGYVSLNFPRKITHQKSVGIDSLLLK